MYLRHLLTLCIVAQWVFGVSAQEQRMQVAAMGFYNLENLFDTLPNNPYGRDLEFTPDGSNAWTGDRYREKQDHMARVISELATDLTPDGVALLGVSEVENRSVLEDLASHPRLQGRGYQIVHFDSPDRRGIDVGLFYQPKYFEPLSSRPLNPGLVDAQGDTVYTRDILYVKGLFLGDTLHVFVNHWPSRRGGEKASAPLRNGAAFRAKQVCDSIQAINPAAKIVLMGDLNDDPVNDSVRKIIGAKGKIKRVGTSDFFNPMYDPYKKGLGSNAWRDAWSLFDQIILSGGLLSDPSGGIFYYQSKIYNPRYLQQVEGQYQGYPYRTLAGGTYLGGYSDHFPVLMYVVKPL